MGLEVIQFFLGNFLEPKLMGPGTNISPIVVLIALALWGMLWGIIGMLLAIPIMSTLVILLSQFPSTRPISILLSEKGNVD